MAALMAGSTPTVLEEATKVGVSAADKGLARFLKWAALGGAGIVAVVAAVARTNGKAHRKIHYTFDPESKGWSFRVPSLGIVGGAETRQEAERLAAEAVEFANRNDEPAKGARSTS